MRDILNSLKFGQMVMAAPSDNTPVVSVIVDRQGFDAAGFVIGTGTLADADATFTVLVEEGDQSNMSDAAAVADGDLIPMNPASSTAPEAQASFGADDDNKTFKIGYRGTKRYIRCTVTPANNSGAAPIGILPVLGYAEHEPVA